jgi:NAD(P)-dependent dehydrogenase (short-subunit alcohol dehydrogenase family)
MTAPVSAIPRVALITGAAGVIGSAIARRFAASGIDLCLADGASCSELARELASNGTRVITRELDVSKPTAIDAVVSDTCSTLGRLDILAAVAGVTSLGSIASITPEEWDRVHSINLRGLFFTVQAALAAMRPQQWGRIITIGSVLAKNGGNPRPWLDASEQEKAANAAYGAAKAGVHALTLYAVKEAAVDGITVNCIAPGPIAGPMTKTFPPALLAQIPTGRMGTPDEVAAVAAFLASNEAAFMTGEIIDINGGLWMD